MLQTSVMTLGSCGLSVVSKLAKSYHTNDTDAKSGIRFLGYDTNLKAVTRFRNPYVAFAQLGVRACGEKGRGTSRNKELSEAAFKESLPQLANDIESSGRILFPFGSYGGTGTYSAIPYIKLCIGMQRWILPMHFVPADDEIPEQHLREGVTTLQKELYSLSIKIVEIFAERAYDNAAKGITVEQLRDLQQKNFASRIERWMAALADSSFTDVQDNWSVFGGPGFLAFGDAEIAGEVTESTVKAAITDIKEEIKNYRIPDPVGRSLVILTGFDSTEIRMVRREVKQMFPESSTYYPILSERNGSKKSIHISISDNTKGKYIPEPYFLLDSLYDDEDPIIQVSEKVESEVSPEPVRVNGHIEVPGFVSKMQPVQTEAPQNVASRTNGRTEAVGNDERFHKMVGAIESKSAKPERPNGKVWIPRAREGAPIVNMGKIVGGAVVLKTTADEESEAPEPQFPSPEDFQTFEGDRTDEFREKLAAFEATKATSDGADAPGRHSRFSSLKKRLESTVADVKFYFGKDAKPQF